MSPDDVEQAMGTSTLQLLRRLLDVAQQSGPAVARRAELSHTELTALEMLTRQAWGPGELARHLGVTSAAASGIVDRLAARGHVERVPHEADRRRTQVVLTESGRRDVLGHLMPMFAALDELDRGLSDAEREVVDRYLAAATEAIRRVL
ncbi:MarR family transcriptional regulator [Nocardioides euryhalodurans]|uniref:MarR family transcriptional regulator n=2 Tax=Nocardioides euryhalodurans TaxID=2518370 RepID=A0A4P7GQQ4_9ACTN|nr:MarR family transcriptional regulator [Nocardioides euryhalodurans]